MDEIQALVDQRSRAKAECLYKEADKLRDEIADKFDIFIDD
jgi:cysteinyl-tRNA synthetase